jgi:hypothetical protein
MLLARKVAIPAAEIRPRAAAASPRLTLEAGEVPDWEALRKANDAEDNVLHVRTVKWLAKLPADLRPMATARQYPRIVNRLDDLWSQCEYTRLYFQSLLIDRRKGRKGFPPEVKKELEALQHYYFEHLSGLPAILWNAVPVCPPRIPKTAFALLSDSMEIDVMPVFRDS